MNEQVTVIEHPEPAEELTKAQLEQQAISRAKREKWASILLDNASDPTSYRLALRLVRDWFGNEYDERLNKVSSELR